MGTITIMEAVITLLILVLALVGPLYAIHHKSDSAALANEFLAKDISLVIQTMMATPGSTSLHYSQNTTDRVFIITDSSITVHHKDNEHVKYTASFAMNPDISVSSGTFTPKEKLRFIKNGNSIIITADSEVKAQALKLHCPNMQTSDPDWRSKKIILDLAHGASDGDVGHKSEAMNEKDIVDGIARYLSTSLDLSMTRQPGSRLEIPRKDAIPEDAYLVLSLNVGSSQSGNEVNAYIDATGQSADESFRLACMIVNSIAESFDSVTSVRVLPISKGSAEHEIIEGHKGIAIYLEIGNINDEAGRQMLLKTSDIGMKIHNSIEAYFT